MAVILEKDLERGRAAFGQWCEAARERLAEMPSSSAPAAATASGLTGTGNTGEIGNGESGAPNGPAADADARLTIAPRLPRPVMAMAVRYSLFLLERKAPGPGVEVRVAPWGAIKILDGPASDPHNLTPPDVIELDPPVWLRLAAGITSWDEEKSAGHISAVGERDDLGWLLPL